MKKSEKVFIIAGLAFLLLLSGYVLWIRGTIEAHKAYVLAKVTKVSVGGENGPVLYFNYRYNHVKYSGSMSGFFHMQDSLVLIKISTVKPSRWIYTDVVIPDCLVDEKKMDSSWEVVPSCYL